MCVSCVEAIPGLAADVSSNLLLRKGLDHTAAPQADLKGSTAHLWLARRVSYLFQCAYVRACAHIALVPIIPFRHGVERSAHGQYLSHAKGRHFKCVLSWTQSVSRFRNRFEPPSLIVASLLGSERRTLRVILSAWLVLSSRKSQATRGCTCCVWLSPNEHCVLTQIAAIVLTLRWLVLWDESKQDYSQGEDVVAVAQPAAVEGSSSVQD